MSARGCFSPKFELKNLSEEKKACSQSVKTAFGLIVIIKLSKSICSATIVRVSVSKLQVLTAGGVKINMVSTFAIERQWCSHYNQGLEVGWHKGSGDGSPHKSLPVMGSGANPSEARCLNVEPTDAFFKAA